MDKLLSRRSASGLIGLLQITVLCLAGLAAVSMASETSNWTTVMPTTPFNAFQQASHSAGMFTFNKPGRSFVEYRHVWPSVKSAVRLNVQLRFRTTRSSGIMALLSSVSEAPSNTVLPTTLIRLHRGSLHVSISTSRDQNHIAPAQSGIVIGRDLNDDRWHNVSVTVDLLTALLTVDVTSASGREHRLMTLMTSAITSSGDESWSPVTSVISLGGVSGDAILRLRGNHFVGCLGDVTLFGNSGRATSLELTLSKSAMQDGCPDHCHVTNSDNKCDDVTAPRRCVNNYVTSSCDCSLTNDNSDCQQAITLQGSDWLLYNVYDADLTPSYQDCKSIAFMFKTTSTEGVLFYGRQQYPVYSHLAVSLTNATLHVSVVFAHPVSFNELYVTLGNALDDDRWHSVRVSVTGNEHVISATLDDATEKMSAKHDDAHLRLPPYVYYGGMDVSANTFGLRSQKNFIGCLRDVFFNEDNLLDLLNFTSEEEKVKYHGDGPAMLGCHDLTVSCIQFTHDAAFARIEHSTANSFELHLSLKTLKPDCILTYTETSAATERGYIQTSLTNGQLQVSLLRSVHADNAGTVSMSIGTRLNDNSWHTLRVVYRSRYVLTEVDDLRRVEAVDMTLQLGEATYLGFGPNTNMNAAFIGCLRNVRIQTTEVNPVKVVHSPLGVGLTLGDCDLIDRCRPDGASGETVCQHGGRCTSSWQEAVCQCPDDYRGQFCETYADVATVTFQTRATFVEFVVDAVNDVSFSFLPTKRTSQSTSTTIHQLILLALSDDNNRSLTVYLAPDNNDNKADNRLLIERRLQMNTDRLNISLSGRSCADFINVSISLEAGIVLVNGRAYEMDDRTTGSSAWLYRAKASNMTQWQLYVGGRPSHLSISSQLSSSPISGFVGCLSHVFVDGSTLQLAEAAAHLTGIRAGCNTSQFSTSCQQRNSNSYRTTKVPQLSVTRLLSTRSMLSDYSQHRRRQQQQRIMSPLDDRMMLDADAGQSSYKRDAGHDAEEGLLLHTSWIDWRHGVPQHSGGRSTLIGLMVVAGLLAAGILLAALLFVWRRMADRRHLLTLHHLCSNTAVRDGDEEQGLLTDITSSAAAADNETAEAGKRSQASRPNRLMSPSNLTGNFDGSRLRRNDIRLSMFMNEAMTYRDVTVKSGDELDRDQVPHSDTEDLDASTAPQMEWDPQTDVASPMLPIQGDRRYQ